MPEKHLGFKTTAKFFGWIIGMVVLIFEFLLNWITTPIITSTMIAKVLTITAVTVFGIPALFYLSDIMWTLADKVKEALTNIT